MGVNSTDSCLKQELFRVSLVAWCFFLLNKAVLERNQQEMQGLGAFPSLAVGSLVSCIKSLPFSVFSVSYIRTACSASPGFWWMRRSSVRWSLYFLEERHYKRAGYDIIPKWGK